jgi:mannose-6-phosphate isomerase-like protein (cupin superfamily)
MFLTNLQSAKEWFEVLQTTGRSQTAVMNLAAGESSGDDQESHRSSDQVLLVLEGEILAEIAEEKAKLRQGDVVIVPAGTPHRFENQSEKPASTFTVYAPPAYPPDTKG